MAPKPVPSAPFPVRTLPWLNARQTVRSSAGTSAKNPIVVDDTLLKRQPVPVVVRDEPSDGVAMAAVLDVPELFHLVLSFLPARDLFNVAAVSKGFRSAVWTSHGAQKTMFLRTRPILPGRWYLLQSRKHRRRSVTKSVLLIEPLPHKPNTFGSRYEYTYEDFDHLVELCPWLEGTLVSPPYKIYSKSF